MSAERLTVWLEPFEATLATRVGVLCRRHADAMVVPNRWSLDDRRPQAPAVDATPQPEQRLATETAADSATDPQLFVSHASAAADKPAKKRKRRDRSSDDTGQLELLPQPDTSPAPVEPIPPPATEPEPEPEPEPIAEPVAPWKPVFDQDSDLEGLLDVRSPLLSRAFRGRSPKP